VPEAGADLGGTWFWNRYPGARFDSESYSYGYSFSRESLDEWDTGRNALAQPENLRYLNYVADKLDLRRYMQFNRAVESAHFHEAASLWRLRTADGRELTWRILIPAIGVLSAPVSPNYQGLETFRGTSHHTFEWPGHKIDFTGERVAVVGTGPHERAGHRCHRGRHADHVRGHPDEQCGLCVRRHHLRDRLRRGNGTFRPHRHPRCRRRIVARQMV
jgi:cation diffusion facilitator CzcD-associated flavoprotein CzcO